MTQMRQSTVLCGARAPWPRAAGGRGSTEDRWGKVALPGPREPMASRLPQAGGTTMANFKRILVPTDFTETSDRAIDYALSLAERLGSSVTIMHAYEIPIIGFPDGALVATADIATQIANASRAGLDSAVSRRQGAKVKIDGILRDGVAWEEINKVADEIVADLIVIGTHGRRGIARALRGSVAENVIRTAHHPVLTIHGPREK